MAFTVELPEPSLEELTLEPTAEATRGLRGAEGAEPPPEALQPLPKRLSLGGPTIQRVDRESSDDVTLQRFLEDQGASYDFYLLRQDCSLRHDDEAPFASAVVTFELTSTNPDSPAPIAWSMDPLLAFDPVSVSRKLRLDPSLKFLGVGLRAGAEIGEQRERKEVLTEALYELEPTPTWQLFRTGSTQLRGVHRFHLVVQAPKGATAVGTVTISATVKRKRFGLIAYRVPLPEGREPVSFELAPGTTETARLEVISE